VKYIVVYTEGGDDIATEEFETRGEAEKWLEENNFKAQLIEVSGTYNIEDHT
jgi:hypothetical protein